MFFLRLACTCEETCESVWPLNASLYASSTCLHLRLLAGPFDQGFIPARFCRTLGGAPNDLKMTFPGNFVVYDISKKWKVEGVSLIFTVLAGAKIAFRAEYQRTFLIRDI